MITFQIHLNFILWYNQIKKVNIISKTLIKIHSKSNTELTSKYINK